MSSAAWFLVVGSVLLCMAFTAVRIERLPLSTALIYLGTGILLGPTVFEVFHFNPLERSALLEVLAEIGVLISLFGAGLKLAAPVGDRLWWVPFRLAFVSMLVTVGLTAVLGMWILGLSLGAAVLLGAILAPTDPVLATDVQVKGTGDNNRLRFALTGEAGLNDGTAFPMVMLGLGLMGLHELGPQFSRWFAVDVVWATFAGFAIGGALGGAAGWLAHRLGETSELNKFTEDLLGLGIIAVAYGVALLLLAYGFLAVFAAGFMFHRIEARLAAAAGPGARPAAALAAEAGDGPASGPGPAEGPAAERISGLAGAARRAARLAASARLAAWRHAVAAPHSPVMTPVTLKFIEQLERLGEVALIILIGGMLFADSWQLPYVAVALLLLFVVRPAAVAVGLAGTAVPFARRAAMGWFGVRGIGSIYYLMYALQHGVPEDDGVTLISVVLVVVALSIVLHGVTVTPLMRLYTLNESRSAGAERDHPANEVHKPPDH